MMHENATNVYNDALSTNIATTEVYMLRIDASPMDLGSRRRKYIRRETIARVRVTLIESERAR